MKIAIDGPASSGKTSLGRRLAAHYNCLFVDTGAMYRALALGVDRGLALEEIEIILDEEGKIFLNGEEVTALLRNQRIDQLSSEMAMDAKVRRKLVRMQRQLAKEKDVVMEGRDIGTIVLPDAEIKIFLVASPSERAQRRAQERSDSDIDGIANEIALRDARDIGRSISPLKPATDAITIITDKKSLQEVAIEAIDLIEKRIKYLR
ncbi:(d)CMP kinase [Candidatus Acetothermia bacterium]|jgi:cytidylate kinase|nr:(d)CMP kinase [Candidatus Acetothermia bacterium]